jgi:hypothetical protein
MNMIEKFATSLVAVAAFSAIIYASASADSMKSAQPVTFVAAADASQSRVEPFSYPYDFTLPVEPFSYPYDFTLWAEPVSYPNEFTLRVEPFNYAHEFTRWAAES